MSRRTFVKRVRPRTFGTQGRARAAQAYLRSRRTFVSAGQLPRLAGIGPRAFVGNSLAKQVRALVKSKKRDATDIDRSYTFTLAAEYTDSILTSSTANGSAASGSGLLDCDADEVMINSVRFKGEFSNANVLDNGPTGNMDTRVRRLVVWYHKPLQVADSAGDCPPITEVLMSGTIDSLPISGPRNGGRFTILSDRTWTIGMNTHYYTAGPPVIIDQVQNGRNRVAYDYTVPVKRMCKFVEPASSGTTGKGGHFDSDLAAGQVSAGLLVQYTFSSQVTPQNLAMVMHTRLNYTG